MKLKKVFIIIVIILILILLGFGIYSLYKYLTPVTVTSSNNEFSIQIPGKVDFKEAASGSSEYVLDLYSLKDQMMLYSTIIDNVDNNISLEEAITSEKDNVSNARENARDISDVIKMDVPNCEAYKYTFTYYDSSLETDLYSNVVWIQTEKNTYILDFEVILENKDKYTTNFDDIATSFKENN
ncbi:unknown [Clostridium sp. CAG:354]|nr:unknown [Clostridium sp. CAG:354]